MLGRPFRVSAIALRVVAEGDFRQLVGRRHSLPRQQSESLPEIKLSSDQLGLISIFQNMSGATVRDCIVDEKGGRLIFIINKGQMGLAIGKKGATIQNIERVVKKPVEVVEWSDDPAEMIRNALDPRFVSGGEDHGQARRHEGHVGHRRPAGRRARSSGGEEGTPRRSGSSRRSTSTSATSR